jgi:hypothetical protein
MIRSAHYDEVSPEDEPQSSSDAGSDYSAENTKPEDQTMKAALKRLDRKYDDDGDKIYLERKSGDNVKNDRDVSNTIPYPAARSHLGLLQALECSQRYKFV